MCAQVIMGTLIFSFYIFAFLWIIIIAFLFSIAVFSLHFSLKSPKDP